VTKLREERVEQSRTVSSPRKTECDSSKSGHHGASESDTAVFPYSRIVFIDSTWNQCRGIYIDERITGSIIFIH
jgi:hypothetical protein